jgi:hypothetical protein
MDFDPLDIVPLLQLRSRGLFVVTN